jgi:hypothetical protein
LAYPRFNQGQIAWVIESGMKVRPVRVLSASGSFATVKFLDTSEESGMRVRESRLYRSQVEAERNVVPRTTPSEPKEGRSDKYRLRDMYHDLGY